MLLGGFGVDRLYGGCGLRYVVDRERVPFGDAQPGTAIQWRVCPVILKGH